MCCQKSSFSGQPHLKLERKSVIIERRRFNKSLKIEITAHFPIVSTGGHVYSCTQSHENWNRVQGQTQPLFSPLHSWPVKAWSGCKCPVIKSGSWWLYSNILKDLRISLNFDTKILDLEFDFWNLEIAGVDFGLDMCLTGLKFSLDLGPLYLVWACKQPDPIHVCPHLLT